MWSPKEYGSSITSTLALAQQFSEGVEAQPEVYKSLSLWDNTVFPAREVSLDEFRQLTLLDEEEATRHAAKCIEMRDLASVHARRGDTYW